MSKLVRDVSAQHGWAKYSMLNLLDSDPGLCDDLAPHHGFVGHTLLKHGGAIGGDLNPGGAKTLADVGRGQRVD